MKKTIFISTVVVMIILLTVGCSSTASGSESIDISEVDTSMVGEEVVTGDVVWTINEVRNLGEQIQSEGVYTLASEEGNFINVDFEITNNGPEAKQILDLKVIDDQGRSFKICIEAYGVLGPYSNDACTLATILPGESRAFNTTFDTAANFEKLVLEVTDLNLPAVEIKYVDLGL